MHDSGAILEHYPELKALRDFWQRKRGSAHMPNWRDFRDDELDRWDPQLNVIAVRMKDGELDFVYKRFAGVITDVIVRDMTGESLGQGLHGVRAILYREHCDVVDTKRRTCRRCRAKCACCCRSPKMASRSRPSWSASACSTGAI